MFVNRSTKHIPIIYHIIPYKKHLHCAKGCRFSSAWLAEFRMAVVHNVGGLNFMVPTRETRSGHWNGSEKLEQQQNFQRYQNPTVWFNTFQNIIVSYESYVPCLNAHKNFRSLHVQAILGPSWVSKPWDALWLVPRMEVGMRWPSRIRKTGMFWRRQKKTTDFQMTGLLVSICFNVPPPSPSRFILTVLLVDPMNPPWWPLLPRRTGRHSSHRRGSLWHPGNSEERMRRSKGKPSLGNTWEDHECPRIWKH